VSGPLPNGDRLLRVTRDVEQRLPWYATLIVSIFMAVLAVLTWEKWFIPWLDKPVKDTNTMRKIYSMIYFASIMMFTIVAIFPVLRAIWFTGDKDTSKEEEDSEKVN